MYTKPKRLKLWSGPHGRLYLGLIISSVGGGGGASLSKPYRYVLPQMVGFLRRFALKTGKDFTHFGLGSGMVFEQLRKCMKVFIVSIPNE